MAAFIVHSAPSSPFGRAIMALLEEKGADWTLAAMSPGQSRREPHLTLHPFGRLPVLEHGDFVLYETQAILRYLDRALPAPPFTPADARAAARMDQLMGINDAYLFPECSKLIVFQRLVAPVMLATAPDEAVIAGAMPRAHLAFEQLARFLGDQDYLTGTAISLADLMIGAQLSLFARTPEWRELTADRTTLADWLARMEGRPSFRTTAWPNPSQT